MAKIIFNKEYNFWDILVAIGVQPSEGDKYEYSERGDVATLTVNDTTQQQLDDALASYDHRKYLDGLPLPMPSETEILTNYILDVDMRLVMVEMGLL